MLRFENKTARRPPNYLSRRLQGRLMMLVVGLGAVLFTMNHLRQPETVAAIGRVLTGDPPTADDVEQRLAEPPRIAAPLLATIEDNAAFRSDETEAWFAMLTRVRDEPAESLAASALGPLSYAQLTRQPQVYRGRVLRVAGVVRRVEEVTPRANDHGVTRLYRVILQGRGGEAWPTTLYALEPPANTPLGEDVELPAESVGLFFKNWSYRWRDGLGVSPVIVVRSVRVLTAAAAAPSPPPVSPVATLGTAALVSAVLLLLFWRRTKGDESAAAPTGGPPLDFSQLSAESADG